MDISWDTTISWQGSLNSLGWLWQAESRGAARSPPPPTPEAYTEQRERVNASSGLCRGAGPFPALLHTLLCKHARSCRSPTHHQPRGGRDRGQDRARALPSPGCRGERRGEELQPHPPTHARMGGGG